MQKKQTILVVASLLVVVLSVTLAYFTVQIIGKGKDVTINSADLKIIFTDSDGAIFGSNIEPGWSDTKTLTIENKSNETYKYNIVVQNLVNTFVTEGYLQYKITSTNGGYNMTEFKDVPKSEIATDTILAYSVSIPVGVTQSYTVEFKYANDESIDQSDDMGKKLSGKLFITEGSKPTLLSQILADKSTVLTRTDFSTVLTDDNTKTLYTSTEDSKTVYYFAGNATDNWVKFGKTKINKNECTYNGSSVLYFNGSSIVSVENESQCLSSKICKLGDRYGVGETVTEDFCTSQGAEWTNQNATWNGTSTEDIYWRIIRTNSDGSVRLLYHGTSTTATDAYIGTSEFNKTYKDSMYVGYMYGTSGSLVNNRTNTTNSTIKGVIDTWYKNNLNTNYGKYISTTAVYCNDRSNPAGGYNTGNSTFYYGAFTRLITNKTPTYDCAATEDKFTVDSSTGNGKLTYPIALMTADEAAFAGGVYQKEAPTWYYYNSAKGSSTGSNLWSLLSPGYWGGSSAFVFGVDGSSRPGYLNVFSGYTGGVRPALSLKSCVKYSTGNGTPETPYEIVESSSGC